MKVAIVGAGGVGGYFGGRLGKEAGVATPVNGMIHSSLLPLERRARRELSFD
jgi:ketopantoate reductase